MFRNMSVYERGKNLLTEHHLMDPLYRPYKSIKFFDGLPKGFTNLLNDKGVLRILQV